MSPRKTDASPSLDQPVRLYKVVALSFLFLTLALLSIILFMSSKRATITIVTKDDVIEVRSLVQVADKGNDKNIISGVVTSTRFTFSKEFQPTGSREEPGVAGGKVMLHNEGSLDQPLVATTRLLTPDGVLFRLKQRVTVPANGIIEADVYADQAGPLGNIGPVDHFTIPGLNAEKQKVIYGSSDASMSSGVKKVDIVTLEDVAKAEKEFFVFAEEEGKKLLLSSPDIAGVFEIKQKNVASDVEQGIEVNAFTITGTVEVIGILYDGRELQERAEKEMMKRLVDESEIIQKIIGDPIVTISQYDLEKGTATLEIVSSGTISINPETNELQKSVFFGKNKDEIRRYLLSLDHVYQVEVKFTPMWVRTVPYVPEHVTIIVRKVE